MSKRKYWSLAAGLMLGVCVLLMTGCSGGKAAQEQVTLIIKCPTLFMNAITDDQVEDAQSFLEAAGADFAAQYDQADVTVEVKVFDYVDEIQAISEAFDTDLAADVLFEDFFNMSAYVHTGRVVPLDDVISDALRADIGSSYWEMSTVDGKTYMLPFLSRQNVMIYNKSMLQACGLGEYVSDTMEIQNWTIAEWEDILDTLAARLPEGVYPMCMYGKNNQGDTHIMSMIRAFGSNIFDDEGNFDFESDAAVRALTWIQTGVDRGWYPPHVENLEISDAQELFNNDQLAFYVFNNANTAVYDDLTDYGFVNFPGDVATSFVTGFEVFDNGDSLKLEAAKAFVRYIYENDRWLAVSVGNIPASSRMAEVYADDIPMLSQFTANEDHVVDFMNNSPNWQGKENSVRSVFWPNIHQLLMKQITPEVCAARLDRDCNEALATGRAESTLHE